jgi:hypothetical protein
MSRPFVLAVLGILLAAATFGSLRSAADQAQAEDTAQAPEVQPATVVLFFRQPAADDDATAAAVHSVRGIKGVSVFSAPITKLSRYRRVVSNLGVTQAPAVVVVGSDRKAFLLEGFIDAGTLRQQVKDVR